MNFPTFGFSFVHVLLMTKVDDDTSSFVTLAAATANVLAYLRTEFHNEEQPDRSSDDAETDRSEEAKENQHDDIDCDLQSVGLVKDTHRSDP